MIIYFADRQQNVMGQASTGLPQGLIIVDDTKTEDIETGVASFEVVINYKAADRLDLEQMTEAGNYVFRSSGKDAECYTIIDAETDTKAKERRLYCEDAGLDLLNIICDEFEANEAHNIAWYIEQFAGGSGFEVGTNEIPNKTRTLGWDGEQTGTERIRSVATQFDNAEISYRFTIENMKITHRYIDIWEKRGVDIQQQLRLDRDIDNIIIKRSVANLITGVFATGETLEGEDEPLDLVGYSYDDGDIYLDSGTGILYSRSGHGRWARPDDGNIVGRFNYETGSQSELCNRAVSHLKRYSDVEVNYEVDIVRGLENTLIGDRVNIVDDAGEVYISGRILKLDTSITRGEKVATLGEYLIKSSGISAQILELAGEFQQTIAQTQAIANTVNILSETVDEMFTLEVESEMNARTASLKAHLYNGNKEVTQEHSPALFKWIRRTEDGEHMISRGYTLDIDLIDIGYAGTILCRFIRPVLIDWTDHLGNNITDENGDNIQFSFAGKYSEPVRRRTRMLKALTRASNENEVGYPILAREVNLYERDGFEKKLDPIVQHFWTDDDGAHVTTVEQDEFINNPAGGNVLLTSQGMAIRDGLEDVATFKEDGVALFTDTEEVAKFSATSARIGSNNANNVSVDTDGLSLKVGNKLVGNLKQVTNYLPDYAETPYDNALFLNTPELFAINVAGLSQPALEIARNEYTGGIEVYSVFGDSGAFSLNDDPTYGCTAQLEMFGDRTNQQTFITALTEDAKVSLGVGSGGVNAGVYVNGTWLAHVDGSDRACMPRVHSNTTSTGANMVVTNSAGVLARSTSSSKRYKKDITDIKDAEALYDVKVRQFKFKDDYLDADDQRYGKDVSGFIVEELEKVYPIAVDYEDGQAENWNVRYIVPPMLKLIQDQKKELDALKQRIEELEKR